MLKVLLIINPSAGKQKIHQQLFGVVQTLSNADFEIQIVITKYHNHAMELAQSSEKDLIICAGGDGTLNQVISGLIKGNKNTPIGYIPCGSTNDFAYAFNINNDIIAATNDITKRVPHKIDIGCLNDDIKSHDKDSFFSYIASFGLFSAVSYQTPQEIKNTFGHAAYVFEGMKDLGNIKVYNVTVDTDDKLINGDYIFGAVLNTTSIGGVVKLNADVDLSDGLFEVVLVKNPNNIGELLEIFEGISASDFSGKMFDFIKTEKLSFHFKEPVVWSLDGEKRETDKNVYISNLHRRITIYK